MLRRALFSVVAARGSTTNFFPVRLIKYGSKYEVLLIQNQARIPFRVRSLLAKGCSAYYQRSPNADVFGYNGSEVEGKDCLRKLMELPFQDKKTAAAAGSLLSSLEAAILIGLLMGMYKDDEEMERHGKILFLISLLVDSHSTQ
ncbi:hypothetical protein PRIPAC_91319 [Pristionchus pacificus]|uniref:Uncharacterized protein n=1 Tax=Pristionchus pacificus TaxID=54126 RepID=A0A2A6B7V1_PRIPA|nr:hypothetical protein PRIPAC_91319 [Pristionchus pacificus]|eukprot:PDM61952.1 hypothetical protein PRIPAC_51394 [Pristionchus pacificus]